MEGTLHIYTDSDGNPNLLGANRNDDGSWLNTYWDNPDNKWNRKNGFAFVVSQLTLFLLLIWGSFVLLVGRSNRLTFFQFHSTAPTGQHIFCYLAL